MDNHAMTTGFSGCDIPKPIAKSWLTIICLCWKTHWFSVVWNCFQSTCPIKIKGWGVDLLLGRWSLSAYLTDASTGLVIVSIYALIKSHAKCRTCDKWTSQNWYNEWLSIKQEEKKVHSTRRQKSRENTGCNKISYYYVSSRRVTCFFSDQLTP